MEDGSDSNQEQFKSMLNINTAQPSTEHYSYQHSLAGCPQCGYCRHCGRGGHIPAPWYPSPYMPTYPTYPPNYPYWGTQITSQGGLS